ncbi:MAG: putative sugar O-methyltransferase [Thermoanaerobaculia bacterium]
MARRGFERIASRLVYPWQRSPIDLPSHSGKPLPSGSADALRTDHPRLRELSRAYRDLASPMAADPIWTDELLATADFCQFRGDNPYVFQLRGRNLNEVGYALSYYCARRVAEVERLGLLDRLEEDGLFGVHTFEIDGRRVSRDLLDSALELAFLERHLGLSRGPRRTILDIGAGYGRLAHRAVTAFPETVRYLCTDAIATSTFLSEYYLGFRGLAGGSGAPVRVLPLHELAAAIRPGEVDIAVNIHSFSECPLPAIDAWLAFLAANRVGQLMIVPNAVSAAGMNGIAMMTNAGEDFSVLVRRHGYALSASEPKYPDPVVQEYGVSPAAHLLFRLEA